MNNANATKLKVSKGVPASLKTLTVISIFQSDIINFRLKGEVSWDHNLHVEKQQPVFGLLLRFKGIDQSSSVNGYFISAYKIVLSKFLNDAFNRKAIFPFLRSFCVNDPVLSR